MGAGSPSIEEISARLDELQAACDRLSEENAELRTRLSPAAAAQFQTGPDVVGEERVEPRAGMSRRGLIRTALKATAAAAVGTALVGQRVLPAGAANGSNVTAGNETLAEAGTTVKYDGQATFSGVVLLGNDTGFFNSGALFPAAAGGWAGNTVPNGVFGYTSSADGNGVVGRHDTASGTGNGVLGEAIGATSVGVLGTNTLGTGVLGSSDSTASNATAVKGVITNTLPGSFSSAVRGQNRGLGSQGIGVHGSHAGTGFGMLATSAGGIGISADGGTGIGVYGAGATGVLAFGTTAALSVSGPSLFTRSGTVSIAAGAKTATVGSVTLTGGSLVLATAQNSVGVFVASVVPNIPGSSFKITLNKAVPATKTAVIGWFVVN